MFDLRWSRSVDRRVVSTTSASGMPAVTECSVNQSLCRGEEAVSKLAKLGVHLAGWLDRELVAVRLKVEIINVPNLACSRCTDQQVLLWEETGFRVAISRRLENSAFAHNF